MVKLRLRYENGHFVPLDEVSNLNDGEEIEVEWYPSDTHIESIREMLDRTAGLWVDVDGIENYIEEHRANWDEEWQHRLDSL